MWFTREVKNIQFPERSYNEEQLRLYQAGIPVIIAAFLMILLSSEGRTSKSWTKLTFVQGTKLFWDEGERKMGSDPQGDIVPSGFNSMKIKVLYNRLLAGNKSMEKESPENADANRLFHFCSF